MKTIIKSTLTLIAFIAVQTVLAQDAKPKHNDMSNWPELKSFHVVMSQTFHPSEEGNLKPIRERSGELYEKALALEKSKIPAEFNKPEIVAATKELTAKTKEVADAVKANAADEKITSTLSAAHDSFHKIVGLCRPGHDHDGERHEHDGEKHKE